ncbi:VanW family protein [Gephyromycinifex aptenodytis]|uniref:VanW family protein n=1 Tax=Gephyromycinifex aptenodytis TaxID=2716227 RepID=UPI001446DCC0|nr:VanW family protein [Gephyromycinifex aptenodytis]
MAALALRRTLGVFLSLSVLFAVYAGAAWVLGRQLPAEASVGGVTVGGLTAQGAVQRLTGRLQDVPDQPMTVLFGPEKRTLIPREAGLSLDLEATLAGATGFSLDPREVWFRLSGGGEYPLQAAVDVATLAEAVTQVAADVDRPVRQASVTFPGADVEVVRSQAGISVDIPGSVAAIAAQWPRNEPVTGVVQLSEPDIAPSALDHYIEAVADRAVAEPVVLVVGRSKLKLAPVKFAPLLATTEVEGKPALAVSQRGLHTVLQSAFPRAQSAARDARPQVRGGAVVIVPDSPGQEFDLRAGADALIAALGKSGAQRVAAIPVRPRAASRTAAQVKAWGISQPLASVTLPRLSDPRQEPNAQRVAAALDGAVIAQGESLRLSNRVGPVETANGFTPAPLADLSGDEVGGGAGLVSSALYEAAWRAGMLLGPRTTHQHAVPGISDGLDATMAGDVLITNDTDAGVVIACGSDGGDRLELWGKPGPTVQTRVGPRTGVLAPLQLVQEGPGCRPQGGEDGFDVRVERLWLSGQKVLSAQKSDVHYEPRSARQCRSVAQPQPQPQQQPLPAQSPPPGSPTRGG